MSDQDVESRLTAIEEQVAKLKGGGSAFRPITSFTAHNPLFVSAKAFDHRNLKDRTRSIFVPIFTGTIRTGTPAITVSGGNTRYRAWAFDAAATEEILCEVFVPTELVAKSPAMTAVLWFTNLGAGTGDIQWSLTVSAVNEPTGNINTDLNTSSAETAGAQTFTAAAQNVLSRTAFTVSVSPSIVPASRSLIRITLGRVGGDPADTLANDAGVVGLEFTYLADM